MIMPLISFWLTIPNTGVLNISRQEKTLSINQIFVVRDLAKDKNQTEDIINAV